jgi:hypothetical protein
MAEYTPTAGFSFSADPYTPTANFELLSGGEGPSVEVDASACVQAEVKKQPLAHAEISQARALDTGLDAGLILEPPIKLVSADSAVQRLMARTVGASQRIQKEFTRTAYSDARLDPEPAHETLVTSLDAELYLDWRLTATCGALLQKHRTDVTIADASTVASTMVTSPRTRIGLADSALIRHRTLGAPYIRLNASLARAYTATVGIEQADLAQGVILTPSADSELVRLQIKTALAGAQVATETLLQPAIDQAIASRGALTTAVAAQVQKERTRTPRANAWLKIQPALTAGIDADLGAEEGVSTHAAAQLQKEFAKSAQSNARVSSRPTFTVDLAAVLGERNSPTVSAAAQLSETRTRSPRGNAWVTARRAPTTGVDSYLGEQLVPVAGANAALQKADAKTTATSAYLYLSRSAVVGLDSYVAERHALTAGGNALKARTEAKTPRANARLTAVRAPTAGANARLGAVLAQGVDAGAALQGEQTLTFTASALAYLSGGKTADADSYVAGRSTRAASGNALKTRVGLKTPGAHAYIRKAATRIADIDARLGITLTPAVGAGAALQGSAALSVSATGFLYQPGELTAEAGAQVSQATPVTLTSASVLAKMRTRAPRANAWLRRPGAITPSADSDLGLRRGATAAANSCVQHGGTASLAAMALLSGSKATASNALLRRLATRIYGADSTIQGELSKTATGSVLLTSEGLGYTVGADAAIYPRPFRSYGVGAGAILEAA